MNKRQKIQRQFAQNFLKDQGLVRKLVRGARIDRDDTVIEIGPGRGIITAELAMTAGRVIGIEKDPRLVRGLRKRFSGISNVEIVECDFLAYEIPVRDYEVFASIPFNRTADIVRKLFDRPRSAPSRAHLIMQKQPARKFAGIPHETMFSLLAKPFFEFDIVHQFRRTDFIPVPEVDSVMLRIARRRVPLLDPASAFRYRDFVRYGFERYKPNLRLAFKKVFSYRQWKRIASDMNLSIDSTPTQLSFDQWLGLFEKYRSLVVDRSSSSS